MSNLEFFVNYLVEVRKNSVKSFREDLDQILIFFLLVILPLLSPNYLVSLIRSLPEGFIPQVKDLPLLV